MIKFSSKLPNGDLLVGLGLSRANVKRLMDDHPISFDMAPLDLPAGKLMIFFGETEAEMQKRLEPFIGKDTRVSISGMKKIVVSTMSALALVMLQPLVIPWLGQWLLERGL